MTTKTTLSDLVDTVGELKTLEDDSFDRHVHHIGKDWAKSDHWRNNYRNRLSQRLQAEETAIRHMQAQNLVTAHGEHFSVTLVAKDAYGREHQLEIKKK